MSPLSSRGPLSTVRARSTMQHITGSSAKEGGARTLLVREWSQNPF